MREEEILGILADWNFWGKKIETGIERAAYLNRLVRLLDGAGIVVELGVRRSGKSYIARQTVKHLIDRGLATAHTLIIDLNDERLQKDEGLLNEVYAAYRKNVNDSGGAIIVIDEPQEIAGWEKFVRGVSERKEARFIVTGSSSRLLSSEFSTLLSGRHAILQVYPLSFREYLHFRGIVVETKLDVGRNLAKISAALERFLLAGGFPAVALSESKNELLNSYFDTILVKDVASRYKIRNEEKLRTLAKFYLTNIAHSITYNSISKFTKIPTKTVERFSNYIASAYLLFFVKRFSFSLKEQENSPRKVYSIDNGISFAAGFNPTIGRGALIENAVAVELLRRGKEIYYWKDAVSGKEVDFVIKSGNRHDLMQVAEGVDEPNAFEREKGALQAAMKRFGARASTLVVAELPEDGVMEELKRKKIKVLLLWRFLLESSA